jgi:hypothetical protein
MVVHMTQQFDTDAWCAGCRDERPFETPACDDHGSDCPELACVVCGWAIIGAFEVASVAQARASEGLDIAV